ncbi:MAG: DUF5678 domain-containing protein [Nitrososphaerales archaeon]
MDANIFLELELGQEKDDVCEKVRDGIFSIFILRLTSILEKSNVGLLISEVVYQAPTISPEEYEKYRGKCVALYEGKIIADGSNSIEAIEKALENILN